MAEHLTESLLQRGLRSGFDPEVSRDLLIHLDGGCPSCSEVVRGFAGRVGVEADGTGAPSDPVVLALRRWVGVLRNEPFPVLITAPHLFWAERLPSQTEAFPRVVVEEAFLTTMGRKGPEKSDLLAKLVVTLADAQFQQVGEKRWYDLQAVAHASLAIALHKSWEDLVKHVGLALRGLDKGTGDPEVCAVVHFRVSAARAAGARRAYNRVDKSDEAERLLLRLRRRVKFSGHLAELRIHQGTRLFWKDDLEGAIEKLTEGVGLVPWPCKWLRFFALLRLVNWGLLLDRPKFQERRLLEAEKLAERYFEEERGALFHVRGLAEMEAGRLRRAEESLRSALDRFRQTHDRGRTLHVLRDLHRLYLRSDRAEDAASLRDDVRALVQSGEWSWRGKDRDVLLGLVEKLGDSPWLRKQLRAGEVVH